MIQIIIQCYELWNHEPPIGTAFPYDVNKAFDRAQGRTLTRYQRSGQILYEMGYCTAGYSLWAMKAWGRI